MKLREEKVMLYGASWLGWSS